MKDTIYREDAIKSMANAIWHYPNELYTGLNSYEMCEALAKDGLMRLPSAEPDPEWRKKHYEISYNQGYVDACKYYENLLERKKGKWIAYGDIPKTCPYCHEDWDKYVYGDIWYNDDLPNYCPNCGEDMRGKS